MQGLFSTLVTRKNIRCIFAVAFVIFLLVEWGSHSLAFAHASPPDGMAAVFTGGEHEDPCKTLIRCSDGRRQDQQLPNFSHDRSQQNAFFGRFSDLGQVIRPETESEIPFATSHRIFRPIDPPFHPPELS